MKITSKLVVGMLVCSGLVQVARAGTQNITIELENKKQQKGKYKYAIGNNLDPKASSNTSGYKPVLEHGTGISFDDAALTYLYIRPNKSPKNIQVLELKSPNMRSFGMDIIVIPVKGNVRYESRNNLEGLRQNPGK